MLKLLVSGGGRNKQALAIPAASLVSKVLTKHSLRNQILLSTDIPGCQTPDNPGARYCCMTYRYDVLQLGFEDTARLDRKLKRAASKASGERTCRSSRRRQWQQGRMNW